MNAREIAKLADVSIGVAHEAIQMSKRYPERVDDVVAGTHTWADIRREEGDEPSLEEKRLKRVLGSLKQMGSDDLLVVMGTAVELYEMFNTEQEG